MMNMSRTPDEITEETADENLQRIVRAYEAQLEGAREFASHICHEVNNPLTGLLGQTQLLLRENLSDKARKRVETIETLAMRIRDTIVRLRQFPPHVDGSSDGDSTDK
jgi:signal transduction histidine kinase